MIVCSTCLLMLFFPLSLFFFKLFSLVAEDFLSLGKKKKFRPPVGQN